MIECIECGNPRVENRETMLCASCNAARRKAERQASKVKVVQPTNKVSAKRAGQMVEYLKLKREYLIVYPACEVEDCNNKSVDIHHQKGREGDLLTNENYFMAVCRDHHIQFTEDSKGAIEKGYSYLRTKNT